jgi:hypothetical protein
MKAAGVERAILTPPAFEGGRNDKVLEAAQLHPGRLAVMGRLALEMPESRSKIVTWNQQPGMLGVRLIFVLPQQWAWLSDGTPTGLLACCGKSGPNMIYVPAICRRLRRSRKIFWPQAPSSVYG